MGFLESGQNRVKDGMNALAQKIPKNPFEPPPDHRSAVARNDFKEGFSIDEYTFGREEPLERSKNYGLTLKGTMAPHQPFTFGGGQRVTRDFYPGHSEPTIHVLGSEEDSVTIKGRLFTKHLNVTPKNDPPGLLQSAKNMGNSIWQATGGTVVGGLKQASEGLGITAKKTAETKFARDSLFYAALSIQQRIDAIRLRGNLLRIRFGEWVRWGIMEKATFDMKTINDIEYSITFILVGFAQPNNYIKLAYAPSGVPPDETNDLVAQLDKIESLRSNLPPDMPKSFADQMRDAIDTVAKVVTTLTNFVNTIIAEAEDIISAIKRAEGMIKNAKAYISRTQRRLGINTPYGGTSDRPNPATSGVNSGYNNASYVYALGALLFGFQAILSRLQAQLKEIAKTAPLARYRVINEDTLQKIAHKYYKDDSKWSVIYDHNKLTSTELIIGQLLEIPRT